MYRKEYGFCELVNKNVTIEVEQVPYNSNEGTVYAKARYVAVIATQRIIAKETIALYGVVLILKFNLNLALSVISF